MMMIIVTKFVTFFVWGRKKIALGRKQFGSSSGA